MNLYAYVGGDPVNYTDPSGLDPDELEDEEEQEEIVVTARRNRDGGNAGNSDAGVPWTSAPGLRISGGDDDAFIRPTLDGLETARLAIPKAIYRFLFKPKPKIPPKLSVEGHIFRDAKKGGHYPKDTPAARRQINEALNTSPRNDQYGNQFYYNVNRDGTQTWVRVRNGEVTNAGLNASGAHR